MNIICYIGPWLAVVPKDMEDIPCIIWGKSYPFVRHILRHRVKLLGLSAKSAKPPNGPGRMNKYGSKRD